MHALMVSRPLSNAFSYVAKVLNFAVYMSPGDIIQCRLRRLSVVHALCNFFPILCPALTPAEALKRCTQKLESTMFEISAATQFIEQWRMRDIWTIPRILAHWVPKHSLLKSFQGIVHLPSLNRRLPIHPSRLISAILVTFSMLVGGSPNSYGGSTGTSFTMYTVRVNLTDGALSRLMSLNDCPQVRWRELRPSRPTRPMKKLPN
jgi:hypothetical protein